VLTAEWCIGQDCVRAEYELVKSAIHQTVLETVSKECTRLTYHIGTIYRPQWLFFADCYDRVKAKRQECSREDAYGHDGAVRY
jgi:hypothetical protein